MIHWLNFAAVAFAAVLTTPPTEMAKPQYDSDGRLVHPEGWQQWTLVGTSLGLGYADREREGPGSFKQVYVQPEAFDQYRKTGTFPRETMLAMAIYTANDRAEPAQQGWYADRLMAVEVAVKDAERFDGGWGYFDMGAGAKRKKVARAFPRDRCAACHAEHAQVDNVFVQFYPVLRHARAAELRRQDAPEKAAPIRRVR